MSQISEWILIVGGELLGLLAIVCGVLVFLVLRRSGRDQGAVRKLVRKIKKSENERLERLRNLLTETHRFPDTELRETAATLLWNENRFYKKLIALYVDRDEKALVNVDEAVNALLQPYQDLLPRESAPINDPGVVEDHSQAVVEVDAAVQAELGRLQDENQRLSHELGITMDSMSKVLSEYAFLYGGGKCSDQGLGALTPERLRAMLRGEDEDQISTDGSSGETERQDEPVGEEQDSVVAPAPDPVSESSESSESAEQIVPDEASAERPAPEALIAQAGGPVDPGSEPEALDETGAEVPAPKDKEADPAEPMELGPELEALDEALADSLLNKERG